MLNFLPIRHPSVSLLYGKRPIQRISIGGSTTPSNNENADTSHQVEIPLSLVDSIYEHANESVKFHQNTYHPLQWKAFMQLKLDSYYLMEAAQVGDEAFKSALTNLDWYASLTSLYAGNQTLVELDAITKLAKPNFTYPIQGKNI